jgi:hypothetical protein
MKKSIMFQIFGFVFVSISGSAKFQKSIKRTNTGGTTCESSVAEFFAKNLFLV